MRYWALLLVTGEDTEREFYFSYILIQAID